MDFKRKGSENIINTLQFLAPKICPNALPRFAIVNAAASMFYFRHYDFIPSQSRRSSLLQIYLLCNAAIFEHDDSKLRYSDTSSISTRTHAHRSCLLFYDVLWSEVCISSAISDSDSSFWLEIWWPNCTRKLKVACPQCDRQPRTFNHGRSIETHDPTAPQSHTFIVDVLHYKNAARLLCIDVTVPTYSKTMFDAERVIYPVSAKT